MSRRIEIELTSKREDGTWTWRAAGALQPKGVVADSVVPASARRIKFELMRTLLCDDAARLANH